MELPICPEYHPASELRNKPGCYPNISAHQLTCVQSLKTILETNSLDINTDDEIEFLKLLRFLRARNFDVEKAFEMIAADIKWRNENNRLHIPKETAKEVVQCDLMQLYNYFPTWLQGYDKQCRPVSYRAFGKLEIWNVLKITTMENLVRFHAWESEMAILRMREKSREVGYNIETFTCVIDSAGWGMRLATRDAFEFIKSMAATDSNHYPERLGTLIVINAPSVLAFAWKVIRTFLDEVTKAKIKIFSSDRKEWEPVLFDIIDKDQIPMKYGGTAPDLPPEEALEGMNPPPLNASEVAVTNSDLTVETS